MTKTFVTTVDLTDFLWYFEWVQAKTIFGDFSENVVQGLKGQGETRQEHVLVCQSGGPKWEPPRTQKINPPLPCSPPHSTSLSWPIGYWTALTI